MKRQQIIGFLVIAMSASVGAAQAHHSFAMFDGQKEQVLTGVVTEFQWTNPHTWVELDVVGPDGARTHWSLESGSVTGLLRQGWRRTTLKPGDKISVVLHPLKSGQPGGSLMGVVTADGKALGDPLTAAVKK